MPDPLRIVLDPTVLGGKPVPPYLARPWKIWGLRKCLSRSLPD